jgi:hypothetical protein
MRWPPCGGRPVSGHVFTATGLPLGDTEAGGVVDGLLAGAAEPPLQDARAAPANARSAAATGVRLSLGMVRRYADRREIRR